MTNVKKLTAAIAMAIGSAGASLAVAQSVEVESLTEDEVATVQGNKGDEVLFPYVVSSPSVTTILSVVNQGGWQNAKGENKLHWVYHYKTQPGVDKKADREATCLENNTYWSTSPNDLVDVSVDGLFNNDDTYRGAVFEVSNANVDYGQGKASGVTMARLANATKPVRAFVMVDNWESGDGSEGDLVAARATIIEFINGAAWGYAGYDREGGGRYDFNESNERFGEVIDSDDKAEMSFKPFGNEGFTTMLYVTPIGDTGGGSVGPQYSGKLQTKVYLDAGHDVCAYDRDEVPQSCNGGPQKVTCVGAVNVQDFFDEVTEADLEPQGGWSKVRIGMNSGDEDAAEKAGLTPTDQATVLFLEWNNSDVVSGVDVGGVINNGYMLRDD